MTRRVYRLADQSKRIWSSRHYRKHLILHDLSEGEALGSFPLRSLWMPMKLNWWIGVIFTIGSVLLPAFVMMSGISNNQSYSFMGIVSGALMILLGLVIVGIVQTLMGSMKSEQTMLNSVRWCFSGCARVTSAYAWERHANRTGSQVQRKRYLDSMVLPASAKVQALKKRLEYKQFPDNSPDKVQQLDDAMQSIVNWIIGIIIGIESIFCGVTLIMMSLTVNRLPTIDE